jgi:hypothetical protein
MTTSTDTDARGHARAQIENALIPPKRQGGMLAAIEQLEARLRRYGPQLTADDFDDIRSWLAAHIDPVYELLAPRAPDRVWSDNNNPES